LTFDVPGEHTFNVIRAAPVVREVEGKTMLFVTAVTAP
jgi:hypothetical protein